MLSTVAKDSQGILINDQILTICIVQKIYSQNVIYFYFLITLADVTISIV